MNLTLWAGSHTSYETYVAAQSAMMAYQLSDRQDKPELPDLLTIQSGVGIIDIQGSLVNGNAGFMRYFGVTGYGDVRDALAAAVTHPDVQAILLNIDSGGGSVSGVHETAQLIQRVGKIKPVLSYTGGVEASAALWLGSAASTSYTAETALVGSLGVLMVHAERSVQLANDGIKVTVIRAGEDKARANPYESLTDKAKVDLENRAAAIYDVFLGQVASSRGISTVAAEKQFGGGREFVGKAAVAAGLVDSVGTLEDAFVAACGAAKKSSKKSSGKMVASAPSPTISANISETVQSVVASVEVLADNSATTQGSTMPKPLTEEQLTAMAAGVTLDASDAASTEQATTSVEAPATSEAVAETPDLTAQLAALQVELTQAQASQAANAAALEAMTATASGLGNIVRASLRLMGTSLNADLPALDAVALTDLSAKHSEVAAQFKSSFKVGRVAAANTTEEKPEVKAKVNPLFVYAAQSLK